MASSCPLSLGCSILLSACCTWRRISQQATANLRCKCTSYQPYIFPFFTASFQRKLQLAQLDLNELAQLASTDTLIGLANRQRINGVLDYELLRRFRYGNSLALILFDIDNFKSFNDSHGHTVGDTVLSALSLRGRELLRDTLGRWGGEEFIILPYTTFYGALAKAQGLCRQIATTPLAGHTVTISCGVAELATGDTPECLLQ